MRKTVLDLGLTSVYPKPTIGNQMRHILLILSILLLSSPVIGQETGVLYRLWDGKIVVWKFFGDDDVNKKYEGEIKNGEPNGLGILTSPYGDKHVGGWKKGKEHGQGTYTHPDGNKYVGGWKVGKRHGQGTMTFSSGDKYVGGWKDDKKHGQGTDTSSDGGKYEGEWKVGKRHGQGTLTVPDLGKYVGEWKNGEMWTGIFYDNNGNIEGKMLNGKGIEQ